MNLFKRYLNYIIFALILGLFISGFYALIYIYALNTRSPKTVVIKSSSLNDTSSANSKVDLQIKSVNKLDSAYNISNPVIIDNSTLAFTTIKQEDEEYNGEICDFNIDTNTISEIDNKLAKGLHVLPDKKGLIYYVSDDENSDSKTYLYDFESKKISKTFDGSVCEIAADSSTYIGMIKDNLFMQNINTGERKNIINIKEFVQEAGLNLKINLGYLKKMEDLKLRNFRFSLDGKRIYFIGSHENEFALYMINLDNNNSLEVLAIGDITDLTPLKDGNLIFYGNINGDYGMYLYNINTREYKLLVNSNISGLDVTAEGKVAYISSNNDRINELHTAYLNNDIIESDNRIYSDLKNVRLLKWSNDGKILFCINSGLNVSSILRFNF